MADRAHGRRRRSWTAERPTAAHQSACADIRAVMCSNSGRRSQCRDDCASVIIINDEDVVVVDATRMPSQARKIIAAVRDLTKKPIRTLIHTHWHDDHVYGNQAFAEAFPGLEIIAHQNTREDMQEISLKRNLPGYRKDYPAFVAQIDERLKDASRPLTPEGRGQLERMAARIRSEIAELPALRPVVPNVTFDTSLTLFR